MCDGSGHEEALSRFTLKKLLLLVCFLDRAKESRLIEHNPCLFCLDAEFKVGQRLLLPATHHKVIRLSSGGPNKMAFEPFTYSRGSIMFTLVCKRKHLFDILSLFKVMV